MIRRLLILLLIVGCSTEPEDVYGCTDPTASNFNSNATIFDNTCQYNSFSYWDDIETIQGMDENGNPTEIIGDGIWGGCYEENLYRSPFKNIPTPSSVSIPSAFKHRHA